MTDDERTYTLTESELNDVMKQAMFWQLRNCNDYGPTGAQAAEARRTILAALPPASTSVADAAAARDARPIEKWNIVCSRCGKRLEYRQWKRGSFGYECKAERDCTARAMLATAAQQSQEGE